EVCSDYGNRKRFRLDVNILDRTVNIVYRQQTWRVATDRTSSIWNEDDIHPIVTGDVALTWEYPARTIEEDAIRSVDAILKRVQRWVVHSRIREIVVGIVEVSVSVMRRDVGCVGRDRYRCCEV